MAGASERDRNERTSGFSRRKGRSRRIVLAAGSGLLVVAICAALAISSGGAEPSRGPGPLASALADTEWRFPPDPETGYRRLSTPFRHARIDHVAANDAGVLAWAMELGDRPWIIVWHARAWRPHPLSPTDRVTALGVDPDGVVHVGFADGRLARIRGDGELERDRAVSAGNSIVGFAFDGTTRKSALMLSGGEVRTALRPLHADRLSVVRMPERASIGTLAYDADGNLVVAGAGGAVFVSTEDGWEEQPLPTSGEVVALGLGEGDDLLAVESNGHAFSGPGAWKRIGTVDDRPIAIGVVPGHGVVVASANGRIEAASGEDGGFAHVPDWQAPGELRASQAIIAGANVIFAAGDRLLAWDGQSFDSLAHAAPADMVTTEGCTPVVAAHGADLPTAFFDCDTGHHAVLGASALENVEALRIGEEEVSAADFARAMREARLRHAVVHGYTLLAPSPRGHPPAVTRWNAGTGAWDPFATLDPEAGDLVSLAAGNGDLWAITASGTVFHAALGATPIAATPLETAVELPATVHPTAPGRALVLSAGQSLRICFLGVGPQGNTECPEAEAIELGGGPLSPIRVHQAGNTVLLVEPHRVRAVSGTEAPAEWSLEEGLDFARPLSSSPFDFAAGGGEVLLRTVDGSLARCRDARCAKVPLPDWVDVAGVTRSPDGRIVIAEPDGIIGIVETR